MTLVADPGEHSLHFNKQQKTIWIFTLVTLLSSICVPASVLASSVSVATNPVGLTILVDGIAATGPQTFTWSPGSSHTLSVASPQQGGTGTRYVFTSWSDSGGQTHTVTAPGTDITF